MKSISLICLLLIVSLITVYSQDGIIDPSFASNGKFLLPLSNGDSRITSVIPLNDGSLIFGIYQNSSKPLCVKISNNGELDLSFANSGIASINTGSYTVNNMLVHLSIGGKIVIAYSTSSKLFISQLNSNGSLDSTFGAGGVTTILLPFNGMKLAGLIVDSMNRITIASRCYSNTRQSIIVARILDNGILDSSFGESGSKTITLPNKDLILYEICSDVNSNILLTGIASNGFTSNDAFFLYKLTSTGDFDITFNNTGSVLYSTSQPAQATAVAIQPDNKILIGGLVGGIENGNFGLVRFHENGIIDSSFGMNGLVQTSFTASIDHLYDIIISNDSKVIAGGYANTGSFSEANYADFALARYLADGSLDPSFGDNGKIITRNGSGDESVLSMCLQPDSKIIAAGFMTVNGVQRSLAIRYLNGNPYLYISNISSNEILTVGTQKNIRWGSFDIASIRLELTTDGGTTWNVIPGAEMLPASDSSFLWTIPNTPSANCKIKIIDYNNPSTFSVSPTFQIKLPPINITIQTDTRWFDTDLNGYATKSVNGTASSVPGGTITGYQWSVNGVDTDTLGIVDMTLPTGTNTVTLTVTTNLGFQASKSVKVEVLGAKLGLSGSVLSAVSQSGNLYYVTSQDKAVYGFDSTGTIRKQFLTGGSIQSTLCISSQDLLYVGSDDMRAYCFDNQLNSIWDKAMGGMIKSSPTVSEDGSILYLVTNNGIVKAIDALTGAPKWSYVAGSNILASPILLQLPDDSKAVVIGTQGSYSAPPALIALKDLGNAAELLWEKQVDGPVATSPAFLPDGQNSMFYVASGNGVLYRIRWDGFSEEDWKVNLGSQVNNCSPVIDANGLVFIGTGAAKLLAYAPDFVTTSLPVKTFQAGSAINATPAIGSTGNLYVGTQNGMYYAIDITQDSLIADWIYDAKVPFAAPALVTETGVVVNGATNGDVFLFADPDFHPATEQTYKAYWPTFLGNNKRSKVATMTLTSIPEGDALPKTFALNQNYPNPFNPKTVIGYSLPKQSQVELKVYDILGMEVAVLVNQMQPAGNYTVDFDGVSLPSGVYFYQIKTNEYSSVKKMMLLK